MSADPKNFQERVAKLRSLREKLCSQKTALKEAFEIRDFVVCELQDLHQKLAQSNPDTTPGWCKDKVEHILNELLSIPTKHPGDKDA